MLSWVAKSMLTMPSIPLSRTTDWFSRTATITTNKSQGKLQRSNLVPLRIESLDWKRGQNSFDPIASFSLVSFNMLAPCYKRMEDRNKPGMHI